MVKEITAEAIQKLVEMDLKRVFELIPSNDYKIKIADAMIAQLSIIRTNAATPTEITTQAGDNNEIPASDKENI